MENAFRYTNVAATVVKKFPSFLKTYSVITIIKDCTLKCEYNIHCTNIPTKLSVSCVADYDVHKNPPLTHSYHDPNKNNPIFPI